MRHYTHELSENNSIDVKCNKTLLTNFTNHRIISLFYYKL